MSISSPTRSEDSELKQTKFLNFPEEVHDEIFLKLPAKFILASRCVCKLFNNLLSKPSFIENHVNRTNQSKNNNPKLLIVHHPLCKHPRIYSIGINYDALSLTAPSSSFTTTASAEFDGAVLMNYPFESTIDYVLDYMCSSNGLICSRIMRISRPSGEQEFFTVEVRFCVLNPLTREFKEFKSPGMYYGNITCGFGYDSSIGDYKLVIISDYEYTCCKIDVYTVKSDSWSSIQGTFLFRSGEGYRGVFFNGRLHWLGSVEENEKCSEVILSFDISNEIVVNMPLPETIMPPKEYSGEVYINVGVWGDCLGIAYIWNSVRIDVWVMQEYGVRDSWIRKYTTTQSPLPLPLQEIQLWKPLWCFNNGEILVDTGKQILLYEPKTERVTAVVVGEGRMDNSRQIYVESIVSLGSGTYMEKPITDEVVKNPV